MFDTRMRAAVVLKNSHEHPLHVPVDLAIVIVLVFLFPYFSSWEC